PARGGRSRIGDSARGRSAPRSSACRDVRPDHLAPSSPFPSTCSFPSACSFLLTWCSPPPDGGLEGVRQVRYRLNATELLRVSSLACRAATDRTGPTSCPSSRRLQCGTRHIGPPVPQRRTCRTATGGGRR